MMKNIFSTITLIVTILLSGCTSSTPSPENMIKPHAKITTQSNLNHAQWFTGREEKVPLTIVSVGYIDPKLKRTKEYKQYKNLLNMLRKNPKALNDVLGFDLTSKFSSIEIVDFEKASNERKKFHASYNSKYDSKEKLTDILRPDIEKPSAQILFRVDYKKLRKGVLKIEGYKSIKTSSKARNSYYFELVKDNYNKLNKKTKKQALINSLSAALRLSIPEYISVDRKKLFTKKEKLSIIKEYETGKFEATVYRPKPAQKYKSIESLQTIYTTPIVYNDIKLLYSTNYITFNKIDKLTMSEIKSVTSSLNREFLDPILIASLPDVFEGVGEVEIIEDALVLHKKDSYSLDDLLTSSTSNFDSSRYTKIYKNSNFIEDDLYTGFGKFMIEYILEKPNVKLNQVYVQFKNGKVFKILASKNYDQYTLLKKKKIDTIYFDSGIKNIYKSDRKNTDCFRALLVIKNYGPLCDSEFYILDPANAIADAIAIMAVVIAGSHTVVFNQTKMDYYINGSGFRDPRLFKSEI